MVCLPRGVAGLGGLQQQVQAVNVAYDVDVNRGQIRSGVIWRCFVQMVAQRHQHEGAAVCQWLAILHRPLNKDSTPAPHLGLHNLPSYWCWICQAQVSRVRLRPARNAVFGINPRNLTAMYVFKTRDMGCCRAGPPPIYQVSEVKFQLKFSTPHPKE